MNSFIKSYNPVKVISVIIFLILLGCKQKISQSPILILASENSFGSYTGEILRTEGFNEYDLITIENSLVTASYINRYDIVILARNGMDMNKSEMISKYVQKGGNLIAIRPDNSLSALLGITPEPGIISGGYIETDTSSPEGRGLVSTTLQFHGVADKYVLKNERMIAALWTDSVTRTEYPALFKFSYGKGNIYVFTYDLPQSIVYTRQGNPSYAGLEKDGINGLRAMDLFTYGWLDHSKNTLNQADLQMNLLSNCIENMSLSGKPLPRLWYFPDSLKSLVTLTNDGEYRVEADFETQFKDIDSSGADMTLYVLETQKVTKEWTDKWIKKGFEISGHPDDTEEAGNPAWSNMNSKLTSKKKEMSDLFGIEMNTIVNHWFVWCGNDSAGKPEFAAQAAIEVNHGLGMDINYAHYDNGSNQGHFLGEQGLNQGNFTGSGLVMKFATSKGKILDIYQHLNNVYDQQYNENHDPEGFFNSFKGLLDRSLNDESYSFISIKAHNDEYYFSKEPLLKMIDYANANAIPVWTAEKLYDFVGMRDEARFSDIKWKNNRLSFLVSSLKDHSSGLSVMIPYLYNDMTMKEILLNGRRSNYSIRKVKGYQYAFILVQPDATHSITAQYSKISNQRQTFK